jgi:hypothetical protein
MNNESNNKLFRTNLVPRCVQYKYISSVFCLGSEDESKEGEKQSRKRRHKSISPIVYDKDSSGSESESSCSDGKLKLYLLNSSARCTNLFALQTS